MGMYDHIRFRLPLPNGYPNETQFQTKSLERLLVDYEVDHQGRLWQVGLAEKSNPDGSQRDYFTGTIIFYDYPAPQVSADFRARFDGGVLQSVEQISRVEADSDPAMFASDTRIDRHQVTCNGRFNMSQEHPQSLAEEGYQPRRTPS